MTVLSVPVMTTITSASSGELYSHLPAHSVTHSNSDAIEGRGEMHASMGCLTMLQQPCVNVLLPQECPEACHYKYQSISK